MFEGLFPPRTVTVIPIGSAIRTTLSALVDELAERRGQVPARGTEVFRDLRLCVSQVAAGCGEVVHDVGVMFLEEPPPYAEGTDATDLRGVR